ncbi:MAG: hypothetical protein PHV06_08945, partial [bacterium]|nr:hypothetical protein [bacterium]
MDLIICDIPWYSGLSHYALEVGRVLVNAGITVYWATPEGTDLWSRLKNEKFNLLPIKSRHSRHFFSNYSSITKGLDKQSPERILSFTGSSLLLGYFLKRRYKSKLFRFRTESLKLKKNIFNRMLYNKCDYVVAGNKKIESEINGIGISKTA